VSGSYLPSCFGCSLDFLVRNPLAIREGKPLPPDSKQILSIPKELWQIVDYMWKYGLEKVICMTLHTKSSNGA
jgi:phosphatidylinositol-bisphosphatase